MRATTATGCASKPFGVASAAEATTAALRYDFSARHGQSCWPGSIHGKRSIVGGRELPAKHRIPLEIDLHGRCAANHVYTMVHCGQRANREGRRPEACAQRAKKNLSQTLQFRIIVPERFDGRRPPACMCYKIHERPTIRRGVKESPTVRAPCAGFNSASPMYVALCTRSVILKW